MYGNHLVAVVRKEVPLFPLFFLMHNLTYSFLKYSDVCYDNDQKIHTKIAQDEQNTITGEWHGCHFKNICIFYIKQLY